MKIRKGFVSNSSSASFIVDYYGGMKTTQCVKDVNKVVDRAIKAYNILKESNLEKDNILKITTVDDKLIKKKIDWDSDDNTTEQEEEWRSMKGKVVIHTTDENSVPYGLYAMLDLVLYIERWHWG